MCRPTATSTYQTEQQNVVGTKADMAELTFCSREDEEVADLGIGVLPQPAVSSKP